MRQGDCAYLGNLGGELLQGMETQSGIGGRPSDQV